MEYVIMFFRDVLDGPLYIVVAIIAGIFVCSCIGYLAEQSENRRKQDEQKKNEYVSVSNQNTTSIKNEQSINNNATNTVQNVQSVVNQNSTVQKQAINQNNNIGSIQPEINQNSIPNINSQNLQSTIQETPKI